ncbi:hypothetical protein [Brevibacterium album]|uniref:hypothetical protein n=1 Tax=Brevibacterium album TaxID=417948 RepID=UPI00048A528F|nr:hypothetical protein [Brevibacterium album]
METPLWRSWAHWQATIEGNTGELDDAEGIQHAGGVLEMAIDRVFVSLERFQRRDLDALAKHLAAFVQPVPVGLAGSARTRDLTRPGSKVA